MADKKIEPEEVAPQDDVSSRVDMNDPAMSGREAVERALAAGKPPEEAAK